MIKHTLTALMGLALTAAVSAQTLPTVGSLHHSHGSRTALRAIAAHQPMRLKDTSNNPDDTPVTLLNETFASLAAGTLTEPVAIELDDDGNIPEQLIGESGYGFGGEGLYQGGGALVVNVAEDEGYFWTPVMYSPLALTITFEARTVAAPQTNEYINVHQRTSLDGARLGEEWEQITDEWKTYTFTFYGSRSDVYFEIYTDYVDFAVRNMVVSSVTPAIMAPVCLPYTDFTDTSFTAHWTAVEGATKYYLSVYEYDDANNIWVQPYLLEDVEVDGTSYVVTGIVPGKIYYYGVQASDGRNYSVESATYRVAALPTPQGVHATFNADDGLIFVSWDPVPGANNYETTLYRQYTAPEHIAQYDLVNVDFSSLNFDADMDDPYEPDEFVYYSDLLPTWTIVCPWLIDGAIGVTSEYLYVYFGYPAAIQSPPYNLAGARGRRVHIELDVASSLENPFSVSIANWNASRGAYIIPDTGRFMSDYLSEDFQHFDITLIGTSANCIFDIRPVPYTEYSGDLFIRNLRVWVELDEGGTVGFEDQYCMSTDSESIFDIGQPDPSTSYAVEVVAYDLRKLENVTNVRLMSATSERTFVDGLSGVTCATAEAGEVHWFNLQGIRCQEPTAPGIYIRRQGTEATKVLVK